jgi:hypothetical protein
MLVLEGSSTVTLGPFVIFGYMQGMVHNYY